MFKGAYVCWNGMLGCLKEHMFHVIYYVISNFVGIRPVWTKGAEI